jgi:NAD(P)-dependent dehydrogenase (short-subunit alcohol dehydrogenase family)
VLADIDQDGAERGQWPGFGKRYGKDNVRTVNMDVTRRSRHRGFADTVLRFGGLDIVVNNAGITIPMPRGRGTTLDVWNKQRWPSSAPAISSWAAKAIAFSSARTTGGSMIFISSKNGVAASPGASAYCTMKAAEIHLARCMALEGAPFGIRVNTVNPDAVLRGSKIWQGGWSQQRAEPRHQDPDELEEHYRKRSLLQRSVYPEDIAEAVYFFASDLSNKSTGNIPQRGCGQSASFTR